MEEKNNKVIFGLLAWLMYLPTIAALVICALGE